MDKILNKTVPKKSINFTSTVSTIHSTKLYLSLNLYKFNYSTGNQMFNILYSNKTNDYNSGREVFDLTYQFTNSI